MEVSQADHVLFMFDNAVPRGTISASSEASADLAASNMLSPIRSEIWRSDSNNVQYIDCVLAANEPVGIVALVDINVTNAGTIRVQSWSDGIDGNQPGEDVTVSAWSALQGYGAGFLGYDGYGGLPTVKTLNLVRPVALVGLEQWHENERYWRITLDDPNVSYKQCSLPYIGPYFQPSSNISWQSEKALEYRTNTRESRGGQRYGNTKRPRMILTGDLSDIPEAEADYLWLRHLELSDSLPFIVSLRPDGKFGQMFTTIYGTFGGTRFRDEYLNHQSTVLRIEESL